MNANLTILPIAIPMAAGVLTLVASPRPRMRRAIGVAGLALNLLAAIAILAITLSDGGQVLVFQNGDWPAPFGISVVVDAFAGMMLASTALVLFATFIYCDEQLRDTTGGLFHPLFHLLATGVQWSLITGDLFNLFVAFEIMLMASYAMLILGTSRKQMRQAYKYVLINLLASMLFVTCCGWIYGHLGTLNIADLARLSHGGLMPPGATPAICMLLLVFGIKSAVFPLWFWLPDTYPTVHAGLGGLFGGLLTKVGAYVLLRIFVMTFGPADGAVADVVRPLILAAAGVTMFFGVLGAVSMNTVRRILSIHIMSQVGYMVLAVGIGLAVGIATDNRELAVAGGIFFIIHNMIVKSSLFLCGGLMCRSAGTDELSRMGGMARRTPWLAALFLIAALSLAGLPPLSGFFAKFVLIRESIHAGYFVLAGIALVTSVLTLLSMVKIWSYAFWSSPPRDQTPAGTTHRPMTFGMAGTAILVVAAVAMGLGAEQVLRASRIAARSVVDPSLYIDTVLNPRQLHPVRTTAIAAREEKP